MKKSALSSTRNLPAKKRVGDHARHELILRVHDPNGGQHVVHERRTRAEEDEVNIDAAGAVIAPPRRDLLTAAELAQCGNRLEERR